MATLALFLSPTLVFATAGTDAIDITLGLLNRIIPLIFAVALIWLLWSLVQFFLVSENPGDRDKVLKQIIYIVVVLTVMVSIWGLVAVARNTFGLTDGVNAPPTKYPQFNP